MADKKIGEDHRAHRERLVRRQGRQPWRKHRERAEGRSLWRSSCEKLSDNVLVRVSRHDVLFSP